MTTPFSLFPAAYAGARPGMTPDPVPLLASGRPWLGRVGSTWGMIELPSPPPDGYQITPASSGETEHALIGGGTATTYFPNTRGRRAWVFDWPALELRDLQIVEGFYARAFGVGPWAFVNPEGRNRLTRVQSLCTDASVWAATGGAMTADATLGYIPPSGSLLWTPAAAGDVLVAGSVVAGIPTPDVLRAAPYVPAEPFTTAFYAQAQTGTASVSARTAGVAADGSGAVNVTGTATTVGTTPAQVAAVAAPGAFGSSLYLLPELVSNDGHPVLISCPMTSYTAEVIDWGMGEGVPRVVCPRPADPAEFVDLYDRTATLTLSESSTKAA